MKQIGLKPAYGRDYKSHAEVIKALMDENKDFIITDAVNKWCGKPVNYTQLVDAGYASITVRYCNLKKALVVDV